LVWLLVFFIAGLYEKRAIILRNRLSGSIVKAHITNSIIAVLFFYFIPFYEITPKTNLFIYLSVSLLLIYVWRVWGYSLFDAQRKQQAVLIARGQEMKELYDEVNKHERYDIKFSKSIDLDHVPLEDIKKEVLSLIQSGNVSMLVIDFNDDKAIPLVPALYDLIFSQVIFVDMHKLYESIFDRIPLSRITHNWFLENVSFAPTRAYDALKRVMDIVVSLPAALFVTIIVYPLVWIAMQFDEGKGLLSIQERVGQNNRPIKMYKFRTMKIANDGGKWGTGENYVTRVGEFLRKSRIDELPQFWNVVFGDISLIGPRPEFFDAVKKYESEIPYYSVRHLIKPGLSGWAQIYHDNHPHHGVGIEQTKEKLSYDLYYIKNRSFILDITIALKTLKKLLSIAGK
jgi:lipopolysaccharide/colanic/teichoic acid biosynthesis glycosyltransferase